MNSIDFSKAPEGATHYSPDNGKWYRSVDAIQVFDRHQGWVVSEVFDRLDALVPANTFEPFTSIEDAQPTGSKHDSSKPLMGAVPPNALLAVAKVLTFGAQKYGRDNWHQVENLETRYMDAALRHINAHQRGEQLDPESGENHLAHAVCSLMFILEKECEK